MLWLELINGVHKKRLGQITSVRMCAGDRCQSGTSRRELSTFSLVPSSSDVSMIYHTHHHWCLHSVPALSCFQITATCTLGKLTQAATLTPKFKNTLELHCNTAYLLYSLHFTLLYFTRAVVMQFVTFFPFSSSPTLHLSSNQIIIACRLSVKW